MRTLLKYGITALLSLLALSSALARSDVLVIVNDNSLDSVDVGEYYAQARALPAQNVVHVKVPNQFYISWTEFQSLRDQILRFGICPNSGEPETRPQACTDPSQPIYTAANIAQLTQYSRITHIVFTRGVPTRMRVDGSQYGSEPTSVDNYLRFWLARHFPQDVTLDFRERAEALHVDGPRWRTYLRPVYPPTDQEYIVGRIDGVDATSAKALIDRTLQAERAGLFGKLYSNQDQLYPWHLAYGLFDESRSECADETTAGHYLNFAQNSPQGKTPPHCRVAMVRADSTSLNEAMPGVASGRQPLVDDAAVYLGHLDDQTAQGGFATLLNWRKDATCSSTLCSTASDPAACRAASTDPFREIDTRCVGVANGFIGYNFQSYPVAKFGSWPTGWEPLTMSENDVPRVDAVGADASGSAWFDEPDEISGPNCYSYAGGILGTSTVPCRAKMYLGLVQSLPVTGMTPSAPPPLTLVFHTRGDSLTASTQVTAQIAVHYRKPSAVTCPAGTSPNSNVPPTACVQTLANNVTVANGASWQRHQFTVSPISFAASPQIDRVEVRFYNSGYVGRIGLDAISVVPAGGTELVRNGSFDGGHLQASSGDYAANFLSRLGGVAFWGSLSHHQSAGYSFYRLPLRSLHFLARGLTLGEAVWLGERANSGILYGDPVYSPTRMRMLPLTRADHDGRFVSAEALRAMARNGTNPSTREVRFSACRGSELFIGRVQTHGAALRCTRSGGWQDLGPVSTRTLAGSTIATSVPFDPTMPVFQEYGDYTLRMQVTGTNPATGLTQTFNDYYPVKHRYSDAELAALSVDGTVSVQGRPLSGVTVTLSPSGGAPPRTTETDIRGRYSFGDLLLGSYQVTAAYTGCTFSPVTLTLTSSGGNAPLSCTSNGGGISGRITIAGTGIPAVKVTFQPVSGSALTVLTATDGSYRSPALAAGTYTVSPTKQGWVVPPQTVSVSAGQVTVQDFTALFLAGQIQGFVKDKDTLQPVAGLEIFGFQLDGTQTFFTHTDVNGRFLQGGLTEGTFEISTTSADYLLEEGITIQVGTVLNLLAEPWNQRKLSGFVFTSGVVTSGATVTLRRLPNGTPITTTTDAGGYYAFEAVGDGSYEVQAQAGALTYPARQIQVDRANALNINFGQ